MRPELRPVRSARDRQAQASRTVNRACRPTRRLAHLRRRRFRRRRRAAAATRVTTCTRSSCATGTRTTTATARRRATCRMRVASATTSASRCTRSISPPNTASASSSTSSTNSRPAARPIPTSPAIARSSSASASSTRCGSAPTWFATGHYARVAGRRPPAARASDPARTRPISCTRCRAAMLARTLFPIGDLPKDEVRRIAHERALPVHDKRDSTGICFIGERPFAEFLAHYLPAQPGPIETPDGQPARHAPRPDVLHAGPATGPRSRRRARRGGDAVVRRGQGPGAQRAGRRAAARSPAAAVRREFDTEPAHWIAGSRAGRRSSAAPSRPAIGRRTRPARSTLLRTAAAASAPTRRSAR